MRGKFAGKRDVRGVGETAGLSVIARVTPRGDVRGDTRGDVLGDAAGDVRVDNGKGETWVG